NYARRKHGESEITVEGLMSLGAVYLHQQLLNDAQRVLEEANAMGVRALGPDHGTTLDAKANLAQLYQQQGDLQRAAKLFRDVIDAQYRLGQTEPNRLIPILNLVMCYIRMGRYDQAESMARYGLSLAQSMNVTIENPRTLMLVHNLAATYVVQNRAAEAR